MGQGVIVRGGLRIDRRRLIGRKLQAEAAGEIALERVGEELGDRLAPGPQGLAGEAVSLHLAGIVSARPRRRRAGRGLRQPSLQIGETVEVRIHAPLVGDAEAALEAAGVAVDGADHRAEDPSLGSRGAPRAAEESVEERRWVLLHR